jgi:hypothetical protein
MPVSTKVKRASAEVVTARRRLSDAQYQQTMEEDAEQMLHDLIEQVLGGPSNDKVTNAEGDTQEQNVDRLKDQVLEYTNWHDDLKAVAEALVLKRLLIQAGG